VNTFSPEVTVPTAACAKHYFSSARAEACLTCFMSGSKDKFIIFWKTPRML